MDKSFLLFLTENEFVQVATELQQRLTNEVLEKALAQWPDDIRKQTGPAFASRLKSRRAQLPELGRTFYEKLAKEPAIVGSDEADLFLIERQPNGDVRLQVFAKPSAQRQKRLTGERLFKKAETELIELYGLGGDDEFQITGQGKRGIKLKLYGGEGADRIRASATSKGSRSRTILYDEEDGNEIDPGRTAKVKSYEPEAQQFNATGWLLRHRLH